MARTLIGIFLGIISTVCFVYLVHDFMGNIVVNYAPFFIGGTITGLVCRGQGWLYGAMVALIILLIQAAILRDIVESGRQLPFGWNKFILTAIVPIIVTGIGGFVGQLLSKKNQVSDIGSD